MASKTFINNTKENLVVTLLIRQGESVDGKESVKKFNLPAGGNEHVNYGNQSDIYLNGLTINWRDEATDSENALTKKVSAKGAAPTFDALLNTNSTIIINSVTGMDVSARN